MPITESGITLNFPTHHYFRLGNCEGYKKIQNNFSEMDVCWYDEANDALYLIELKDLGNNHLHEEDNANISPAHIRIMKKGISDHRVQNLLKKWIDTTCMFMSILLNKPSSATIQACAPFVISRSTKINLLSIIN